MADDDFSELYQLAADLEHGGEAVSANVRKAIQVTSHKVKEDAKATVGTRQGFEHAADAITYETRELDDGASSEIGYDKNRAGGALGNLVEFGAPRARPHVLTNGKSVPVPNAPVRPLAPSHDLGNALLNNEADFERGIEKAADDALKEADL